MGVLFVYLFKFGKGDLLHLDGVNGFEITCIFSVPMKNLGEISEITAKFLQMQELAVCLPF